MSASEKFRILILIRFRILILILIICLTCCNRSRSISRLSINILRRSFVCSDQMPEGLKLTLHPVIVIVLLGILFLLERFHCDCCLHPARIILHETDGILWHELRLVMPAAAAAAAHAAGAGCNLALTRTSARCS